MAKRLSVRGIRKHQTYTVEEVGLILRVHPRTVRGWGKGGPPIMRGQKPHLIHGGDLRTFLGNRTGARESPLGPDQVYCLKCRKGVRPNGGLADYAPLSCANGCLSGICPYCEGMAHRFIRAAQIRTIASGLEVAFRAGEESLTGPLNPPSNLHIPDKDAP